MDPLHRALLAVGFAAGDDLGLVLAGGYALTAHELLQRPSRDIDFATATALPLPAVAARLVDAYRNAGYGAEVLEATLRMARLVVSTGTTDCEVDILKEAIGPAAQLSIGPVLSFEDAVGLKMRALHERATHRDFIDVHAAAARFGWRELEALCARHTAGFSLGELADRLTVAHIRSDAGFIAYGLDEADIRVIRRWASEWESDIRLRLAAGERGPDGVPDDGDWDDYLDAPDQR